jgi:uroporphyrinogen-III synthase
MLTGKKILVTRAAHQAGKLSSALRELGATPVEVPVLEIQPAEDFAAIDKAISQLSSYDWLIFTSANAVSILAFRAGLEGYPIRNSPNLKVAAIGPATAAAAENTGLKVNLIPESYVAESLVNALLKIGNDVSGHGSRGSGKNPAERHEVSGHDFSRAEKPPKEGGASQAAEKHRSDAVLKGHGFIRADKPNGNGPALAAEVSFPSQPDRSRSFSAATSAPEGSLAGQRILIARAAIARDVIPDALRAAGAIVDVVDAYRNVMPEAAPGLLRAALEQGIDAATFTSTSSVTHLAEAAHAAGLAFPFHGVAAISIGPITSQTLREIGWEPAAEANPSDFPGLVAALANHFGHA